MLFFEFPEDARWNDDRDAVEFSVILRPIGAQSVSQFRSTHPITVLTSWLY